MSPLSLSRTGLGIAAFLVLGVLARSELATWTNLDGQKMQAEFVGRKGDYVSFRKADGSRYLYPYTKLTDEDRARVDKLTGDQGTTATETMSETAPNTPVAKPGLLVEALKDDLVIIKDGKLKELKPSGLGAPKFVAVYYSAHWCPPCRRFTPELVKTYNEIKAAHPEFELIFVSSDRSEEAMANYMKEASMPWPAVAYDERGAAKKLQRPDYESGIPNLVFFDAEGKELATTYTKGGDYRGPGAVLAEIRKHFKM